MNNHEIKASAPILVASLPDEALGLWCTASAATFTFSTNGDTGHPLGGVAFRSNPLLRLLQVRDISIERKLEIRPIGRNIRFAIIHEQALALVGVCLPPKRLDEGRFYIGDLADVSRIVLEHEIRPNLVFLSAHYLSRRGKPRGRR